MIARDFALLAQEAYTVTPDIGVAASASRAIVRRAACGLVIAFPGTDNGECLRADIDVLPLSVPGIGDVYRGFWGAWQDIADDVMDAINGAPVTLVGHSLGAAIALMAAASMTANGKPPAAVWGFEPPRVSPNLSIRMLLASVPIMLTKKGNDAVPDVPFGGQHAAVLTPIGTPALPIPNLIDHRIVGVVAALQ
jgi:hypothetical protein